MPGSVDIGANSGLRAGGRIAHHSTLSSSAKADDDKEAAGTAPARAMTIARSPSIYRGPGRVRAFGVCGATRILGHDRAIERRIGRAAAETSVPRLAPRRA